MLDDGTRRAYISSYDVRACVITAPYITLEMLPMVCVRHVLYNLTDSKCRYFELRHTQSDFEEDGVLEPELFAYFFTQAAPK